MESLLFLPPPDVHPFSIHRSAPSLCSLQTIHEEPFAANENQPSSSCYLPPAHPKEVSLPDPSQEADPDGKDHLGHLERTSRWHHQPGSEKTLLAPSVSEDEEGTGRTKEEEWTRTPCPGGLLLLHSQVKHNHASDNCWRAPVENSQKKTDWLVQQMTGDGKDRCGSPNQSEKDNGVTPTLLHTTPQGTVAVPVVPPAVVKRTKGEGDQRHDQGVPLKHHNHSSPRPEVYWNATVHDRIWSKLDFTTHRDSMSSSSSMSSNDTVIDLSLPNLARKSLPDLGVHKTLDVVPQRRTVRPWSASATSGRDAPTVTKSKSNPNLRLDQPMDDDLRPRPLGFSSVSRRHTWNRLYVESLKRPCPKSEGQKDLDSNATKSKSLGDLTSDDIVSNSESKYRSIRRSFATRSVKVQHYRGGAFKTSGRSSDELTERLKKLTFFQREDDITSPTCLEPPKAAEEEEEEEEETILIRRSSSRSQSRVRYIANRARQAQERQKLKNLALNKGSPIEERGIPEGACCFPGGPYTDPASPGLFTSQLKNPTGLNPGTEVVSTFRL